MYVEMRQYFPIYEEAISHIGLCNCSISEFPLYEENLILFFISVVTATSWTLTLYHFQGVKMT
jgi:hypothetical protein